MEKRKANAHAEGLAAENSFAAVAHPIAEIEAPDLVRMVKKIEARGALDIAKRSLQTCSQIFRYAIGHGHASRNPAADIQPGDVLRSRKKQNYARLDITERRSSRATLRWQPVSRNQQRRYEFSCRPTADGCCHHCIVNGWRCRIDAINQPLAFSWLTSNDVAAIRRREGSDASAIVRARP